MDNTPTPGQSEEFENGLIPVEAETPSLPAAPAPAPAIDDAAETDDMRGTVQGAAAIEAMRAMRAEMEALRGEVQQVRSNSTADGEKVDLSNAIGGYPWQYYRVGPRFPANKGWIMVLPGGASSRGNRDSHAYAHYLKKGFIPINKYGAAPNPESERGWERFIPLLRKGGAAEFPADQIIAYKWHLNPPVRGIKFPQYEAVAASVKSYVCEACGLTQYYLPEDREVGSTYRGHLMKAHQYPFREAAEAVKTSGLSLTPWVEEPALAS